MPTNGRLPRHLGLLDASSIFVGIILGSGIFVAPAAVAAASGSALVGTSLWIVGGIIAACGALCYAECGARLPHTGGFYVYYRRVFGEAVAFVGGWAAVLITYPASIAAIALIFARYVGQLLPIPVSPVLVAVAAIAASGALNVVGVRTGARTQILLTGAKVSAVMLLCLAALAAAPPEAAGRAAAPPFAGFGALLTALVVLLWTYDGWSDVTLVAGEVVDPGRNLIRTVFLGISVLVVVYVVVQIAVLRALSPVEAAMSEQVVADAAQAGLGGAAGALVALLVAVSTFGSIHGIVLTASRLGYAMASDGVFPRGLGRSHPRFGTPARSVTALVAASILYVLIAGFGNLLAYFSFTVWIFYGLTAVAVLLMRSRHIGDEGGWRAPLGWIAPGIVLLTALGMTASLMAQDPRRSLIGLALLAAGLPVYALWRRLDRAGAQA